MLGAQPARKLPPFFYPAKDNRAIKAPEAVLVFIACSRSGQHKADVALVLQEALRFYNVTTKQKEMLEFALNYLQMDDEVGGAGFFLGTAGHNLLS